MELNYRIKHHVINIFDDKEREDLSFFTAQYKFLGLWLNINERGIGRFSTPPTCYCETYNDAKKRVDIHNKNMIRAKFWWTLKSSYIIKSFRKS